MTSRYLFAACAALRAAGGTVLNEPEDTPEEPANLAICAHTERNEIMITRQRQKKQAERWRMEDGGWSPKVRREYSEGVRSQQEGMEDGGWANGVNIERPTSNAQRSTERRQTDVDGHELSGRRSAFSGRFDRRDTRAHPVGQVPRVVSR